MSKNLTFLKINTSKSFDKIEANAKYIGFRSREGHQNETRGLFDENRDTGADIKEFMTNLRNNKALQHSNTNKAFKVVLSWKEEDARILNIHSEEKYKEIAREFVKDIENEKGMKLDYVGAVHMKDGHPHVHLIISGVGQSKETGENKRLRLDFKNEVPKLKDNIDRRIGADKLIAERDMLKDLRGDNKDRSHQLEKSSTKQVAKDVTRDVFKTLERLSKQAQFRSEQARREQERQMQRLSRQEERER